MHSTWEIHWVVPPEWKPCKYKKETEVHSEICKDTEIVQICYPSHAKNSKQSVVVQLTATHKLSKASFEINFK